MLSFDEALDRVRRAAPRLPSESVLLDAAHGRVLAQPLRSSAPLPAWDYSAMDGFAVRSTSFIGESPWLFPIVGESRTGRQPPVLEPGAVCRIFTGAQVPEGADAVVMQENVAVSGSSATFSRRPAPFEHVRRAGEDLPAGALALEAGTRLGPYQLRARLPTFAARARPLLRADARAVALQLLESPLRRITVNGTTGLVQFGLYETGTDAGRNNIWIALDVLHADRAALRSRACASLVLSGRRVIVLITRHNAGC